MDGFTSGTPVQTVMDGRDALLAVAMNGQPLPIAHGFPARMVVPGLYGYVSATKWVTDINVTTFAGNYAYWAQRGWSQQAPIKTECRIDVPNGQNNIRAGTRRWPGWPGPSTRASRPSTSASTRTVEPGQARRRARHRQLAAVGLGVDAAPGQHVLEARATDKTGYTQTAVGPARAQRGQRLPEPLGHRSLARLVGRARCFPRGSSGIRRRRLRSVK